MSFLKIVDPAKREQTVKEFLAIRKNIHLNELAEKMGKIELQADLSELFKPVTETQKTATREITEGLIPIKEGIKQLPQTLSENLLQQIGYPYSFPPSYRSTSPTLTELTEEASTSKEEEEVLEEDTTFGPHKKGDKTFIGDKQISTNKDKGTIIIGEKEFKLTPGLWTLIIHKKPKEKLITEKDSENYAYILGYTNTMHRDNNPLNSYPKASGLRKWKEFIKPIWERFKGKIGSGVKKVVIPSDRNALLEKLDLLMASKVGGNTGVRNELVSVCDELKRQGIFDNKSYKKIMTLL